jgi:hypothetical protein
MTAFRVALSLMALAIVGYTSVVIGQHGMGLFSIFFGDMSKLGWPGQFNLDFMCMLLLSGLWVSFRHRFSVTGLLLGVCAVFGGATFLSVYLIVASFRAKGDVAALLVGVAEDPGTARRAAR